MADQLASMEAVLSALPFDAAAFEELLREVESLKEQRVKTFSRLETAVVRQKRCDAGIEELSAHPQKEVFEQHSRLFLLRDVDSVRTELEENSREGSREIKVLTDVNTSLNSRLEEKTKMLKQMQSEVVAETARHMAKSQGTA